ncbi:MAG: hypothetical protein WAO19_09545 [Candidatus Kryptoniota bacterium]
MPVELSRGKFRGNDGYALPSVLFLVAVLSILCTIILKVEVTRRETVLKTIDIVKSGLASENGVILSLASPNLQNTDTTFSTQFDDGSSADVEMYQWGLFTGVRSNGLSHKSESVRSAFFGSSLTSSENPAMVLGNLQHGLVFAGNAEITGEVEVGPMGISTGSLKNYSAPRSIPIIGKKITLSTQQIFSDTIALDRHVFLTKNLLNGIRRTSAGYPTGVMQCLGSLSLRDLGDSIGYVYCNGTLSLIDTITRRGPPLYIVVFGSVTFSPHAWLSGPISICSTDSIAVPPNVSIINCILTSEKSITLEPNSLVTAQLFSPVIHFSSNTSASYPSIAASVSFSDTSGTIQSIQLDEGARIEGAVMMHRAGSTSMDKAVITLTAGATVIGGVYTDAYLTLDGTVDGYVRTFDLYFYDSPTTYLGWLRQGIIDRSRLPHGFLKPMGTSQADTLEVLSWL